MPAKCIGNLWHSYRISTIPPKISKTGLDRTLEAHKLNTRSLGKAG